MKKVIVMATKNEHKVREIKRMLQGSPFQIKPLTAFGPLPAIREDGGTLKANALKKAQTIAEVLNCPVLADDSGLFVPALNNQPGVKSARYAGPACDTLANNRKLLRAMKPLKGKQRRAFFATVMALAIPGKKSFTRMGKIWGAIAAAPQGQAGFGYDPLFYPRGEQRTFAEMSAREKNAISHRALALAKIVEVIKKQL
jgi:XTP/dITP diphosphohydrolase